MFVILTVILSSYALRWLEFRVVCRRHAELKRINKEVTKAGKDQESAKAKAQRIVGERLERGMFDGKSLAARRMGVLAGVGLCTPSAKQLLYPGFSFWRPSPGEISIENL